MSGLLRVPRRLGFFAPQFEFRLNELPDTHNLGFAERVARSLQFAPNRPCHRVRTAKNAPRDPFHVLEGRNGLAEIVERGAVVLV